MRWSRKGAPAVLRATLLLPLVSLLPAAGWAALESRPAPPSLQRELRIDGEFVSAGSLAVDGHGTMYVADTELQQVRVFSAAGAPLPPRGRRGKGPGEFLGLASVTVGRADTLFALDLGMQRVTAFTPAGKVAYTLQLPRAGRAKANYQLFAPSTGGLLVQYAIPYSTRSAGPGRAVNMRTVLRNGTLQPRPVFRFPDREALVNRLPGNGIMVGGLPYGRAPFVGMGPGDRLYFAWSGTPAVTVFDLQGRRVGTVRLPTTGLPVRDEDLDPLVDSYDARSPWRLAMQKAASQGRLPETKPAYKALVVDDHGRVWVNVLTSDDVVVSGERGLTYASRARLDQGGVAPSPWWILGADGRREATLSLANNVALSLVKGDRAYGFETDADGVQYLVRYRVRT